MPADLNKNRFKLAILTHFSWRFSGLLHKMNTKNMFYIMWERPPELQSVFWSVLFRQLPIVSPLRTKVIESIEIIAAVKSFHRPTTVSLAFRLSKILRSETNESSLIKNSLHLTRANLYLDLKMWVRRSAHFTDEVARRIHGSWTH